MQELAPGHDVILMAAAVADFRPAERIDGKIKKNGDGRTLRLERTPDILAKLGREKAGRIHVGFALESASPRENALRKLREKHLDLIVVNGPAAMGADRADVELIDASGAVETLAGATKDEIAARIIAFVEQLAHRKGTPNGPG
jgi:phosphopantothenoylcysteine decarboxylase/phosphopantothenate--cysteine ligase